MIRDTGEVLRREWQALADRAGIKIKHNSISALAGFSIDSKYSNEYKTLITQELLKAGILASTNCYVCTEHTPDVLSRYLEELEKVFEVIGRCENGEDIDCYLEGEVCHTGFSRLN